MADTLSGSKFYVCSTAQAADLDQSGFEALTWVEVKGVGSVGETGTQQNIVSYDTMGTTVTQKSKGIANAGDPAVECERIYNDAGQIIMRTISAVADNQAYAFKWVKNDGTAALTSTTHYYRGKCTGPTRPNGRNEDFDLEVYTLGLVQTELTVNPTAV